MKLCSAVAVAVVMAGRSSAFCVAPTSPLSRESVRVFANKASETVSPTWENPPDYEDPGMMKLTDAELKAQSEALDALAARWQRLRDLKDWEDSKLTGFSEQAEIINGRSAMFFIVVGLLTEYWTGQSIPEQITTLLRITGVLSL